jgi:uncharacterized membrane protein
LVAAFPPHTARPCSALRAAGTRIAICIFEKVFHPFRITSFQGDRLVNITNSIVRNALGSLVALAATGVITSAFAAEEHAGDEQCAGVIKAGKNDCATVTNACHGHVETDGNKMAWIYLPKGTCAKIAGARVVKVKDPTPKKS